MELKEIEAENLYKLIATKRLLHAPVDTILAELKLSKGKFYRLLATEEYKAALKEISDEATSQAISIWRGSMAELIKESHRVIREKLAENDLEAVKIVMKSIGVDAQTPTQQATSLTVVLPDLSHTEKKVDIEVN